MDVAQVLTDDALRSPCTIENNKQQKVVTRAKAWTLFAGANESSSARRMCRVRDLGAHMYSVTFLVPSPQRHPYRSGLKMDNVQHLESSERLDVAAWVTEMASQPRAWLISKCYCGSRDIQRRRRPRNLLPQSQVYFHHTDLSSHAAVLATVNVLS